MVASSTSLGRLLLPAVDAVADLEAVARGEALGVGVDLDAPLSDDLRNRGATLFSLGNGD